MDCSLQGSSVRRILQALEWGAIPFSRGSFQSRDKTQVSCIAGKFFTVWATRFPLLKNIQTEKNTCQLVLVLSLHLLCPSAVPPFLCWKSLFSSSLMTSSKAHSGSHLLGWVPVLWRHPCLSWYHPVSPLGQELSGVKSHFWLTLPSPTQPNTVVKGGCLRKKSVQLTIEDRSLQLQLLRQKVKMYFFPPYRLGGQQGLPPAQQWFMRELFKCSWIYEPGVKHRH